MAPKSKQAARRAARRPTHRDGSAEPDSGYELNLYDQLPPEEQRAVRDVAESIFNRNPSEYGTIQGAVPAATRVYREHPAIFHLVRRTLQRRLQSSNTPDPAEEPNFNDRALFEGLPPHIQAEIRPVAADNLRGGLSMQRAMEEAIRTVLVRHPDFVDQELRARGFVGSYIDETGAHQPIFQDPRPAAPGFEPFSGTGRRLDDDLNSLD